MEAPLPLRPDCTADTLRREARRTRDASQARRLLALAAIYEGGLRSAARIGGVGLQIVRDWVVRFNAEGPAGLVDRKAPGPSPHLNHAQRRALATAVERGPTPASDGAVRWRLVDLVQWLWDKFQASISLQTLSCAQQGQPPSRHEGLVRRPGAGRPEEHYQPPLGTAGN